MKKALILNISHNDIGTISSLKKLGFYVIGTGNNPTLPGKELVDEYIQADFSDKELILSIAINKKIDAICSCCNDFGVITAAYVAEKLNLPGHDTFQNALTLHHKNRFKEFAIKHGIITPPSEAFNDYQRAFSWIAEQSFPLMIKPVDMTGGKGCSKINSIDEASSAIHHAFNSSKGKVIVIEPYITGTQHACCTFVIDKKVRMICSNNEYSIVNPYKVEVDTFPADDFEDVEPIIVEQIEKIVNILNLNDGIFHVQYIMSNGVPYIIEVMRRVLGNLYMYPAMKLTGLDWEYWETRVHCGLDTKHFPRYTGQHGFWAYRALMGSQNGIVKGLKISSDILEHQIYKFILHEPNDYLIKDHQTEQLGFLFFEFSSRNEMDEMMVKRYGEIQLEFY